MKTIRTTNQLVEANFISPTMTKEIQEVAENFSVSITPQLIEIMTSKTQTEAISKQFVPNSQELHIDPKELQDPIGDESFSPVKGIVHRYPDRCLLTPILACPVYCRFCFRREKVGNKEQALSKEALETAYNYIRAHKEIWEVILTGGDPLILKPKKIREILSVLEDIETVEVIRIHTRVPVVDSNRVTEEMLEALKTKKALYIVLHANHPSEFTDLAKETCARIVKAGIPMLSQTVLLKGINDSSELLAELMKTFVKNRIKPYYLHHLDLAKGTSHFRCSIQEGQALVKSLRGRYSGLCQPTYVLDIPGGHGKMPISESCISSSFDKNTNTQQYEIEDYQGNLHLYES